MSRVQTFPNRMWDKFHNEIEEANKAALSTDYDTGPGPYIASYSGKQWFPTEGFRRMVQAGRKFKWTFNTRGDVGVVYPTLKHSVASGGGDVLTAGHGTYDSVRNLVTLDNDTGHYHTTEESLQRAKAAWEFMGYNVQFKARIDYTKLFN